MIWLVVLMLAVLALINYLIFRDAIYPGFIQAVMWLAVVLLFELNRERFVPVETKVFLMILGGVFFFTLGAAVITLRHKPYLARNYVKPGTVTTNFVLGFLAFLLIVGLIFSIVRARDMAMEGSTNNIFTNLQRAINLSQEEMSGGFGMLAYLFPLSTFVAAIALIRKFGSHSGTSTGLVVSTVMLALIYSIMSTGRGVLISLMIVMAGSALVLRIFRPLRAMLTLAGLFLAIFFIGGILVDKGGSLDKGFVDNVSSMYDSLIVYTVGSVPALGSFIDSWQGLDLGSNIFRMFFAVAHTINSQVEVAPLISDFTFVPDPTNLYTIYRPYVMDFGIYAAVSFQFVLGLFHGFLYRKATSKNPSATYVFLFAAFLIPLLFQYGGEAYFNLLSRWLQYVIYCVLFLVILRDRAVVARDEAEAAVIAAGGKSVPKGDAGPDSIGGETREAAGA